MTPLKAKTLLNQIKKDKTLPLVIYSKIARLLSSHQNENITMEVAFNIALVFIEKHEQIFTNPSWHNFLSDVSNGSGLYLEDLMDAVHFLSQHNLLDQQVFSNLLAGHNKLDQAIHLFLIKNQPSLLLSFWPHLVDSKQPLDFAQDILYKNTLIRILKRVNFSSPAVDRLFGKELKLMDQQELINCINDHQNPKELFTELQKAIAEDQKTTSEKTMEEVEQAEQVKQSIIALLEEQGINLNDCVTYKKPHRAMNKDSNFLPGQALSQFEACDSVIERAFALLRINPQAATFRTLIDNHPQPQELLTYLEENSPIAPALTRSHFAWCVAHTILKPPATTAGPVTTSQAICSPQGATLATHTVQSLTIRPL